MISNALVEGVNDLILRKIYFDSILYVACFCNYVIVNLNLEYEQIISFYDNIGAGCAGICSVGKTYRYERETRECKQS